jgi:hypothetical protein
MDDILYLIHCVDNPFNINDITELIPSKIENAEHQYPGVFFSLITKQNIIRTKELSYKYQRL